MPVQFHPLRQGTVAAFVAFLVAAAALVPRPPAPTRPNVLLLTVDCLRADRLSCYGYPRPTSPGLDLLARQGVLFEDFVGQSGWTSPGLVTVLTGLYPEVTGIRGRESIPPAGLPALPRLFREAGYDVPNLSYLTSLQNYWNLGYEPPREELLRAEEDRHAVDFIEQRHDRPFFAWYHYRFLHLPYDPPEPWRSQFVRGAATGERLEAIRREVLLKKDSLRFTGEEKRIVSDLYDANVRRMDAFLSSVFAALDRTGLTSNTIVAVTADHGEELFERGWVGHSSTTFAPSLHREIVHIPLLLKAPGRLPAGRRVQGLCGQIDVAPTLLELAGVAHETGPFQGRSLLPLIEGGIQDTHPWLFSSTTIAGYQTPAAEQKHGLQAVTTREWRYLYDTRAGKGQLFDRDSDPWELQPVKAPREEARMLRIISAHFTDCARRLKELATEKVRSVEPGAPPRIVSPAKRALSYSSTQGVIEVMLDSPHPGPFLVEYDVGTGVYRTTGTITLEQRTHRFGPFARELWNTLSLWNPWRFRVSRQSETPQWSPWVEFRVEP